jgi:thiol-disulfide isomerase/thioredoxin
MRMARSTRGMAAAGWGRRMGLTLGWAAVALCVAIRPVAASEGWLTDYDAALTAATESGRPVLTIFTGSDWCPHCKTLEDNVLATDTFLEWASDNVVLLMIDLPQQGISPAVRSARSQVCLKYGVRTFPSALLIGPDGQKITVKKGYHGQTAATWVSEMASHVPARPAAPAASVAATAAPKAEVLKSLEEAVASAQGKQRPILLVVSRKSDSAAKTRSAALVNDPEFDAFTRENFVVAEVPADESEAGDSAEPMKKLLGGAPLPPEAVEIIVTEDGQTPLFSESGTQPPARVVGGLRRFLAARQAARESNATRR